MRGAFLFSLPVGATLSRVKRCVVSRRRRVGPLETV